MLQKLGSKVVSRLADMHVPDVPSGFKAYSREAAMRFTYSTEFDHTVDHVIQAGRKRIITVSTPIRTNEKLRESRLFSSFGVFIKAMGNQNHGTQVHGSSPELGQHL